MKCRNSFAPAPDLCPFGAPETLMKSAIRYSLANKGCWGDCSLVFPGRRNHEASLHQEEGLESVNCQASMEFCRILECL